MVVVVPVKLAVEVVVATKKPSLTRNLLVRERTGLTSLGETFDGRCRIYEVLWSIERFAKNQKCSL